MPNFQKVDLVLFISSLGGFLAVFLQARQILKVFKDKISQESELMVRIDFMSDRIDRLEDFISRNSSFKL